MNSDSGSVNDCINLSDSLFFSVSICVSSAISLSIWVISTVVSIYCLSLSLCIAMVLRRAGEGRFCFRWRV